MAASSCRKYLRSGPRSGRGPRSRSVEACPSTCSSSDITPGSRKVTHWWEHSDLVKGTKIGGFPLVVPYCTCGSTSKIFFSVGLSSERGVCLHPSDGLAESFDAFLQHNGSCLHLPVGFPSLSKFLLPWSVLPSSPWSLVTRVKGWVLADSSSPPPPSCSTSFCLRWYFKEDMMSFVIICALSGLHSGGLGNIFSAYTWQ